MAQKTQYYLELVQEFAKRDANLRIMQRAMDRMAQLDYNLPDRLRKLAWMRTYRTTAPFDALRGATRAMSELDEILTIDPVTVYRQLGDQTADSQRARQKADGWEKALTWQMSRSAKRRTSFRSDIVRSALLYDEVCVQSIYLPYQKKLAKEGKAMAGRWDAALAQGPFVHTIHNPQTVHTNYSDLQLEEVASVTVRSPVEIVRLWGAAAGEVQSAMDADKAPASYLLVDFTDRESRCVFVVEGDDESALDGLRDDSAGLISILAPEDVMIGGSKAKFMSWSCQRGGTELASEPENQRFPLLYPIWKSELWTAANISGSIMESKALAQMANPNVVVSGPNSTSVQPDYTTPGGRYDAPPGTTVTKLPKDGLDPADREMLDRHISEIGRATVASVLITGERQTGETYSSYQLRVQNAVGSLAPYRLVAEAAYNDIYTTELLWLEATGDDLSGYGPQTRGRVVAGSYKIISTDIDPDAIYLNTRLRISKPVDRLQDVQAAIQMQRELKITARRALEEIGVTDPDAELEEYEREQFRWATLAGVTKRITAEYDGQIDQMAQQKAQQMIQQMQQQAAQQQQAQQAQQAQAQQGPPGMGGPGGMPPGGPGMGPGGQGMPPDVAGQMGAQANPAGMGGPGIGPAGPLMSAASGGMPADQAMPGASAPGGGQ